MTIVELREKRAKLWATMEGFLDTHRNDKGVLSSEDDAVYANMEKELNDLKTRYDEFVQVSQQDMQKKQGELLEPIIVKAQDAVKEVSKAGGYTVVYDTSVNAVAYFDEAVVTDILPAVKTKLGIKDTPAAAPAAPAAK